LDFITKNIILVIYQQEMLVIPAKKLHQATLIFLHGLGDTTASWGSLMRMLGHSDLPTVKFVLPQAPSIPVALNGGAVMPAWYNIHSLEAGSGLVDEVGIRGTVGGVVQGLIDSEPDHVKVIVAGFSQGGCIALATACQASTKRSVDAVISLSGYLPNTIITHQNQETKKQMPIFMGHGRDDQVVKFAYGRQTAEAIRQQGFANVHFYEYPGLGHSASDRELDDMLKFIQSVLLVSPQTARDSL
jgi:predicted esterase